MTTRENEFELRLGKLLTDQAPRRLKAVRAAVRQATRRPRASGPKPRQPVIRAHFAPGSKARARPMSATSRRVVVKVRYVANAGGKAAPLRAHVSYLSREMADRDRSPAAAVEEQGKDPTRAIDYLSREDLAGNANYPFFDGANSNVAARAVTQSWVGDPRHFRMIVSAEDGEALGDLKPFIRELMAGLEAKLGTKLEWLAVNHHDTDNPHTHVLIRGRRPDGQEPFIPSRLISSGIREQAQEIVTRVLGPRLAVDLERERFRDINLKTPTPLDRELLAAARSGPFLPGRADLVARLERLEGWDLATRGTDGWRLAPGLVGRLREMAEHEDVARAIPPMLRGREPQLLLTTDRSASVMGELLYVGRTDEFGDRFVAIIETGAGELRYAKFERPQDLAILADIQPGAIVAFEPNQPALRPSDIAIARVADRTGGFYSIESHARLEPYADRRVMEANVRRLENMRRLGLVQRASNGEFHVGDHLSNALAFEERLVRRAPFSAQVASYWSLGEQIDALGPTHLDRVLAGEAGGPIGQGRIAHDFEHALQQRRLFLIEQGWMGDDQPTLSKQALQRMAVLELSAQAKGLSEELGVPVLTYNAHRVSGIYARRIDLAQGRMALILGEKQANLVPWRPALERFAGQQVEGVMRAQGLSWSLSRGLGIDLPPM
jgi:hypothetical protein